MGLMRTLVMGRQDGIRAGIRRRVLGDGDDGGRTGQGSPSDSAFAAAPPVGERALGLQPEAPRDVIPPEGYEVVLHKDALAPGNIVEIIIAGTAIAVANIDGSFHAVSNSCPHADGPLGEGSLNGSVLTCPHHGWQYDLTSGACLTNADVTVPTYLVAIEGDAVCVKL